MKRGVTWTQLGVAMGVVAALAVVSPALGGPSLRSLVKKEVAKQISKATGPAGANGAAGPTGATGIPGVPGTARAYGQVADHAGEPCAPNCLIARSKGVTAVTHATTGAYCIKAPGISRADVVPVASVEWSATPDPQGNAGAQVRANGADCPINDLEVRTERINPATATAAAADDVAFTFMVP